MNVQCRFCECVYPEDEPQCPVCSESNPVREAREQDEPPIGYEAAWIGTPRA